MALQNKSPEQRRSRQDKHKHARSRVRAFFLSLVVFISVITALPLLHPTDVQAATTHTSKTDNDLDWNIKSFLYYRSIAICMKYSNLHDSSAGDLVNNTDRIKVANAKSGLWFNGATGIANPTPIPTPLGVYMRDATAGDSLDVGTDGLANCDNATLVSSALTHWGLDPIATLCNSGFRRVGVGVRQTIADCMAASQDFERRDGGKDNNAAKFMAYIKEQIYGGNEPSLTGPQLYSYYRHSLDVTCITGIDSDPPERPENNPFPADNQYGYNGVEWVDITTVNSSGKPAPSIITGSYIGDWTKNTVVLLGPELGSNFSHFRKNCSEVVVLMNAQSEKYRDWAELNVQAALDDTNLLDPPDETTTTTCGVDGVGWIICPIFNFLSGVADGTYGLIEGFLVTDIRVVDTSRGTYTAWQAMRNFANVGFVIVFLIIVFSQLTGAGITNYGVKKMLPRLVVAAILVNVSFFITQLAVDLSNILGGSLRSALDLPVFDTFDGGLSQVLGQGNTFTDVATGILAAQLGAGAVAGAAVAIYFGGIGLLIPVILAAVVAVIMTLLILIARQAIVILLIVVSPLAFLAMLLPNTENLFKQWRKILVSMLILYPAVALLFAGSQLAAAILIQSLADDNLVGKLSALAVMILPLFALPAILKGSLNAVPAIGGLAQKLANGAISGTRKGGAQATKALGQRAAASNNKFGQFASRSLFGRSREGRNRQSSARRAFEEPRIKDIQDRWATEGTVNDADKLFEVAQKDHTSIEGQAAIARLAQMGETSKLAKIRGEAEKRGTIAAYDKATLPYFAALKAKDYQSVYSDRPRINPDTGAVMPSLLQGKYSTAKANDLHAMSDDALQAGWNSGNEKFRQTLSDALQDPDQARYFNADIRKHVAENGGPVTTTRGVGDTTVAAPSPLVLPHDDPNNPFFNGSRKP